jgi:hypothetical protein
MTDTRPRRRFWALALLTVTLLLSTVLAIKLGAQRRASLQQIDRQEAQRLAEGVRASTGFSVPLDDRVLVNLNDFVGKRRIWSRRAIERANEHRAVMEQELQQAGVPRALLAIPFAESGFDNQATPTSRPAAVRGAGLWQLTPELAQRLGLNVSPGRDERLDPRRATAAASAHLKALHATAGSWDQAIRAHNSADGYAETVFALMLLLHDPTLLN